MNFSHRLSSERLIDVLKEWRQKERHVLPNIYAVLEKAGSEIGPEQRDSTVRWLWHLNQDLEFHSETLALAVNILDRFLSLVKTRPKYLRCIAITCYYLAIKTMEEDEDIPTVTEIIENSECGCSGMDIIRMERIILNKLEWNLLGPTSFSFLHLFHDVLFSCLLLKKSGYSMSAQHLLEDCMCAHKFTQFKGSVLALSIFSLELEKSYPGNWLITTLHLQQLAQIDQSELIRCRELVTRTFHKENQPSPPPAFPVFKNSLATIPEAPEECSEEQMEYHTTLSERHPKSITASRRPAAPSFAGGDVTRFQGIPMENFHDRSPKAKRHKPEHICKISCAVQMLCNNLSDADARRPIQAIN